MEKYNNIIVLTDKFNDNKRLINIDHVIEIIVDTTANSNNNVKIEFDNGRISYYKENIAEIMNKLEIE